MQRKLAGVAVATVILSPAIGTDAQDTKLSLPNVTVTPRSPDRAALPTRSCEILCTEPLLKESCANPFCSDCRLRPTGPADWPQ